MTYYVAPNGDDRWSGATAEPNAGGTDGPFATLVRARGVIRGAISRGLSEDLVVEIRGGTYRLDETLVFGPADSPPAPFTVTYRAYADEAPVFSGAEVVSGWRKTTDPPDGVPDAAKESLWHAPLGGRWARTLYRGDERLRRACEPGFAPRLDLSREEWEANRDESTKSKILFPDGAMEHLKDVPDAEVVVRPMWPWIVNILSVDSVDPDAKIARTTAPATYPISRLRFGTEREVECCWIENTPQGMSRIGDWFHDTRSGRVYLWSNEEPEGILSPRLIELVRVEGDSEADQAVRGIRLEGLTFSHGERESMYPDDAGLQHDWDMYDKSNALLRFRGAEECVVRGCHFKSSGGGAARLDLLCRDNTITQNLIEEMGGTGILLSGYGPGVRDVNVRNIVTDNHIHHCGQILWHAPGIFLWQSGENLVANNLIHHLSYNAVVISGVRPHDFKDRSTNRRECTRTIRWGEIGGAEGWHEILPFLHGRNNVFENNEIHHAMQRLADGNAVYVSGCGEGNIIRRNYIHDMGEDTPAQAAIRTDGWQRGTLVTENVIYDCACGIMRKNYNHVENNIIVNARDDLGSISFRHFPDDEITQGSRVMRNICYQDDGSTKFYEIRDVIPRWSGVYTEPKHCKCDFNLFFDKTHAEAGAEFLSKMHEEGLDLHSVTADPLLADPTAREVTPRPGSPAYALGFKPIDMGRIGLTAGFPERLKDRFAEFVAKEIDE